VSGVLEPVVSDKYIRTVSIPQGPQGLEQPININWDLNTCENLNSWKWIKEGDDPLLKIEFEGVVYKIDKNRGLTKEEEVYDYAVLEMGEEYWNDKKNIEEKEFYGKNIFNLTVDEHLNTMAVFAKYIDSSISKTINIPNDYPYEDFKNVYMRAYDTGYIKGVTTYRIGTMASVVNKKEDKSSVSRPTEVKVITHSPKRPVSLPCDIYTTQIKGEKWNVFIGKLKGYPFEIFAGKATIKLPEKGTISKEGSKKYVFDGEGVSNLDLLSIYGEHGSYFYSKMLSYGVPIWSIVDMCDKMVENILGFNKAMGRILKKYIKSDELKFMKCANCGSTDMVFQEGCLLCKSCGQSRCS